MESVISAQPGPKTVDIFEQALRFTEVGGEYARAKAGGIVPFYQAITRNEGSECIIDNKSLIMMGSNNYLGLTTDPRVRSAVVKAINSKGPSLTGSRLLNGTTRAHLEFEQKLAAFLKREACLVFTTGYQANLGTISAIMGGDHGGHALSCFIIDRQCHASIIDGAKMSGCRIKAFPHQNLHSLERKLIQAAQSNIRVLVMVDGVYSMEGDIPDLPGLLALTRKYGARLAVDDAHAIGVLGACGRGTEEHFGLENEADIVTGTFSKSLASIGGYVAGNRNIIEYIQFHARSIIFSAALPPPQLAAADKSLDILIEEPWRVEKLRENSVIWKSMLQDAGFNVMDSSSPIIPVLIGDKFKCILFAKALMNEGVFANCALHPAVSLGQEMIRTSVIATHEQKQLVRARDAFVKAGRQFELVR